jgi:hypothetical protein
LRALADRPEYRFGYLVSSRRPLQKLCHAHDIASSSFWNIFGFKHVLGLLSENENQKRILSAPYTRSPHFFG